MKSIVIDSSDEKFIISIDKSMIKKDVLLQFVDSLRAEFLAQQVDFDRSIEQLGEDNVGSWWAQNKERFIPTDTK